MKFIEAKQLLESVGSKLIMETYIDLFGVLRVDRENLKRSQIKHINDAKREIQTFLDDENFYDHQRRREIDYAVKQLRNYGAFKDSNMSDAEFMDRAGITDKREEFSKQIKDFKAANKAYKEQFESDLVKNADMEMIEGDGYRTTIAYKDISPKTIRFDIAWYHGDMDHGIKRSVEGLYPRGWVELGYGTLGHRENAPEIPNWTAGDHRVKNWPVTASVEVLKEIHDFLKSHPQDVEDQIGSEKANAEDIARDIANYNGRNWSGD
jgi:hypothetical protein